MIGRGGQRRAEANTQKVNLRSSAFLKYRTVVMPLCRRQQDVSISLPRFSLASSKQCSAFQESLLTSTLENVPHFSPCVEGRCSHTPSPRWCERQGNSNYPALIGALRTPHTESCWWAQSIHVGKKQKAVEGCGCKEMKNVCVVRAYSSLNIASWAQPDTTHDPWSSLPTEMATRLTNQVKEMKKKKRKQRAKHSEIRIFLLRRRREGSRHHRGQAWGQGSGQKGQRRKEG